MNLKNRTLILANVAVALVNLSIDVEMIGPRGVLTADIHDDRYV